MTEAYYLYEFYHQGRVKRKITTDIKCFNRSEMSIRILLGPASIAQILVWQAKEILASY